MRTPGGSQNDFIQAIGGQPVAIGFPGGLFGARARRRRLRRHRHRDRQRRALVRGDASHLYTLPVQWGVAAYGVNLAWWNKLDPPVRDFLQKVMNEVAGRSSGRSASS